MKELNTKVGVFLTTYTQKEIDDEIRNFMDIKDSGNCKLFMDDLRSFNPSAPNCITEKEAKKLTGLEKKKSKKNPQNLYTNYKGNPLGLPEIMHVELFYTDPISSLKSAFEIAAPEFDFEKDFFFINIVK